MIVQFLINIILILILLHFLCKEFAKPKKETMVTFKDMNEAEKARLKAKIKDKRGMTLNDYELTNNLLFGTPIENKNIIKTG